MAIGSVIGNLQSNVDYLNGTYYGHPIDKQRYYSDPRYREEIEYARRYSNYPVVPPPVTPQTQVKEEVAKSDQSTKLSKKLLLTK